MTSLDTRFETSKYVLPIWRQKFQMAEKIQNIKNNGFNSKTIKQNVMFDSWFERYFDFQQYGHQNSKWPRRLTNLQNTCYNSRIIKHIFTINGSFKRYLDLAENQVRKNSIF